MIGHITDSLVCICKTEHVFAIGIKGEARPGRCGEAKVDQWKVVGMK
jgi:hypothetical protein